MNHLKKIAEAAAEWAPEALMMGGAAAFSYGAGLAYLPAGWLVGGAFALGAGWILAKAAK